ncbi:hypothetical protein SUGI_0058260 [Cryptomeria japonica]|nr:hypothetical protein SUGI_0058260 [Cryptomeria japonica]
MATEDPKQLARSLYLAGSELSEHSQSKNEVLVEERLILIEQPSSELIQIAMAPIVTTLSQHKWLRHPNDEVKLVVTSCLSEIMRIMTPLVPYGDDDTMKEPSLGTPSKQGEDSCHQEHHPNRVKTDMFDILSMILDENVVVSYDFSRSLVELKIGKFREQLTTVELISWGLQVSSSLQVRINPNVDEKVSALITPITLPEESKKDNDYLSVKEEFMELESIITDDFSLQFGEEHVGYSLPAPSSWVLPPITLIDGCPTMLIRMLTGCTLRAAAMGMDRRDWDFHFGVRGLGNDEFLPSLGGSGINEKLGTRSHMGTIDIIIGQFGQEELIPDFCTLDLSTIPITVQAKDGTYDGNVDAGVPFALSCESTSVVTSTKWNTHDLFDIPLVQAGVFHFDYILRCAH